MRAIVCVLLLAAAVAVVAGGSGGRKVFFSRDGMPKGWTRHGTAPRQAAVKFIVALKQRNLEALDALFWAVSTPGNSRYQKFESIENILEIVAPEQQCHDAVVEWLQSAGKVHIKSYRDSLEVMTSAEVAEKLFQTKFWVFRKDGAKPLVRAWGDMSMPIDVVQYIDFVEGVSSFPMPHYKPKVSFDLEKTRAGDTVAVVPQTLNEMYKIPPQTNNANPQTSVGVIEFMGENYAPSDSAAFAQAVAIKVTPVTAAHTVGPNDPTNPQIEAALDIEMIATVAPGSTAWFWLEDGQGWLYQFVNHFFSTSDVPQVVSISYGWSESDQCDIDPDECQSLGVDSQGYVWRVNAEFQKIGARGISVLVASGDSGANGRTDPDCTLPYLKPDYPAACPYITSVGATQVSNPKTALKNPPPVCVGQGYACASAGTQEVAVSYPVANFASGGGFANYAPLQDYQATAVNNYIKNNQKILPPASYYNASGRAYPDVAALGSAVLIYQGGIEPVGGTSCSAPEWAAVVAILNVESMKNTNAPLGFLNPWLYKTAADANCKGCFTDITVGDNICTEDGCSPGCQGFKCAAGWDPVTGFGSPNVGALLSYLGKTQKKH